MNLLRRFKKPPTLTLEDLSLPRHLREKWADIAPGERFIFHTPDPRHEACAAATAQGWLIDDVQRSGKKGPEIFTLIKPQQGTLNPYEPDWSIERKSWQSNSFQSPEKARSSTTTPRRSAETRRCHFIGLGIAKSGTSSLAALFSRYRSAHEYEAASTIQRIALGEHADTESWLRARDARAGYLECDSSQLHHWHLAQILHTFPAARFILPIREPHAWLDSLLNHRLARGMSPDWWPIEEMRFGPRCTDINGCERLLAELGRPTLAGALSFWSQHHQRVLDLVPPERLLVIRVERLSSEAPRIAQFAGVAADTLTPATAHQNPARARYQILDRLPQTHLNDKLNHHCAALWQRLLSVADAG